MGQNTARTVGSVFLWLVLRHVSGRIDVLSDVFALITLADALGTIAALRGCHLGHAAGDGATRSIHIAVADAGTSATARGRDGAAGDGDIAAGALIAAADAGTASVVLNIMTATHQQSPNSNTYCKFHPFIKIMYSIEIKLEKT